MANTILFAGNPALNPTLFHQTRFMVGDPCGLIVLGTGERVLMIRDIEAARARLHAKADRVVIPNDFAPPAGPSGDREVATAEAIAEFLRREGVKRVACDRTLALIYADALRRAGVAYEYDADQGIAQRRHKDEREIEAIRRAQADTQDVVRTACETIARASVGPGGVLVTDGAPLTAQRVRALIDVMLSSRGYDNPRSIVACGEQGADCHNDGVGDLVTGLPIIIDVFPRSKTSYYQGDCTRTVVHGEPTPELRKMHGAVVVAKAAAAAGLRAGTTGHEVHALTIESLAHAGFFRAIPPADAPREFVSLQHGTGHGLGLEGHEPPLLDDRGVQLVDGDVVTVEPGLYSKAYGGVRVEDTYLVTARGSENLGGMYEGLDWK